MKKVKIAVGAIIEKEDSILLVKRKKHFINHWTLPVGRLEFGETLIDAIRREVREELSLDFNPIFCCYNDAIDVLPGEHFLMIYFHGPAQGSIKLNGEELLDAQWLLFQDALTTTLGFEHREALEKHTNCK